MEAGGVLRDLLKKAFLITKEFQYDDLTPGRFYRKWSGLYVSYTTTDASSLAKEIAKSMKKREAVLLNNGLLLAAVLVDVKNADLLSDEHREQGQEALLKLVFRMKGLDGLEE